MSVGQAVGDCMHVHVHVRMHVRMHVGQAVGECMHVRVHVRMHAGQAVGEWAACTWARDRCLPTYLPTYLLTYLLACLGEWAARTWARDRCPRRPPLWACGDQEQLTRLLHECGFTSPSYEVSVCTCVYVCLPVCMHA